jgi:hypothetical protein
MAAKTANGADAKDKDEGLKRLGGGRWQTRDERFTIEPQSGTWAVVDAEQTDDLGLALVRGPFKSLTAAKAAIAAARGEAAPASPLKDRPAPVRSEEAKQPAKATTEKPPKVAKGPEQPEEPRWFRDLQPDERRRAARLIERLSAAGASDAEGIVRRDLVGEVPAIAAYAVHKAIRELGADPTATEVADLLSEGRDRDLGVRWGLVDGDGRPIRIDPEQLEA